MGCSQNTGHSIAESEKNSTEKGIRQKDYSQQIVLTDTRQAGPQKVKATPQDKTFVWSSLLLYSEISRPFQSSQVFLQLGKAISYM